MRQRTIRLQAARVAAWVELAPLEKLHKQRVAANRKAHEAAKRRLKERLRSIGFTNSAESAER